MRGQADDACGSERAGEVGGGGEGLVEGFGGLVVGDQDERGGALRQGLDEEGEVERARREGEAGDTATALPGLQVAASAVEGV